MTPLIVYGTRPEKIKLAPILEAFDKRTIHYETWFTDQHSLDELNLLGGNSNFDIGETLSLMNKFDEARNYSHIIVQGDTYSALIGALYGLINRIPVVHVEAGLRSYDDRMVEEKVRRMIDHMATILFPPTNVEAIILATERVPGNYKVVGNTVIDMVKKYKIDRSTKHILVTMHRPENVDTKETFLQKITMIERIRELERIPLIFPLHPRTEDKLEQFEIELPKEWKVSAPLSFPSMVELECSSKLVITDSGGLQEECCYLRVPTLTMRKSTERPETIGLSNAVGDTDDEIWKAYDKLKDYDFTYTCPFGEGDTGERIVDYLCQN